MWSPLFPALSCHWMVWARNRNHPIVSAGCTSGSLCASPHVRLCMALHPLLHASVSRQVPHSLDYCSSVLSSEVTKCEASSAALQQDYFDCSGFLCREQRWDSDGAALICRWFWAVRLSSNTVSTRRPQAQNHSTGLTAARPHRALSTGGL